MKTFPTKRQALRAAVAFRRRVDPGHVLRYRVVRELAPCGMAPGPWHVEVLAGTGAFLAFV